MSQYGDFREMDCSRSSDLDSSSNIDNSVESTENVAPSKIAAAATRRMPGGSGGGGGGATSLADGSTDSTFKMRSPNSYNNYVSSIGCC